MSHDPENGDEKIDESQDESMSRNGNDIRADAAGYAIDAVSDGERARIEARLSASGAESEELRAEVAEMAETAALLGASVDPVTPSDALRQSILARIAVTPQLPPLIGGARAALAEEEDAGQESGRATVRLFRRPVVLLAAAAAAAALFVGGIAVGGLIDRAPDSVSAAEQFTAISTAPDARRISTAVAGGGELELIVSAELQSSAMIVTGLGALPPGSTYQLWYIGEDGPVSAGTFEVSEASEGSAWRILDGDYAPGVTVGVTVEPEGGSEQPTTDPIAAVATA